MDPAGRYTVVLVLTAGRKGGTGETFISSAAPNVVVE
jgi:hypothetical protein